ncbi:SAV_915 family protein [Mycetocola lacteus]|uniref:SAV_915 family protein n=1 Tax=Mycetocola lacteus TaxID=76637 RepID=UPI0011C38F81|nr:SAV_915 family protein [Mycetocola lacteus]
MDRGEILVPPVLYLPVSRVGSDNQPTTTVAELSDGRKAIFAYTALDRLANCCGRDQAWMLIQTESMGLLQQELGFEIISVDKPIPNQIPVSKQGQSQATHVAEGGHKLAGPGSRKKRLDD